MSLTVYGSTSAILPHAMGAVPGLIAFSAGENRLYETATGSLEVLPKSPAEVFGERVLRPLIDHTWSLSVQAFEAARDTVYAADALFSRAINFLPCAEASSVETRKTRLAECIQPAVAEMVRITGHALQQNNEKMVEAAEMAFGPFRAKCFADDTYDAMNEEHQNNLKHHEQQEKLLEDSLKECHQRNSGMECYKATEIGRRPQLAGTPDEKHVAIYNWGTKPGYLCWSIYIDRWVLDKFYASGGYNCDLKTNRPTV